MEVIMRKEFLSILVATGVIFTLVACSSHYHSRYRYYEGHDHASYDYGHIRQLAYDLERSTNNLKEEAKDARLNGHIVGEFEDLNDKAEDFRHSVEHEGDLRRSSDEFRDVSKEYYEARDAMQRYPGYGSPQYVYRDLQRVNGIMSELSRYYGYGR
jgi:hypothetical protein